MITSAMTVALAQAQAYKLKPFMRHGAQRQCSASVRRPGKMTGNVQPTCSQEQSRSFESERWQLRRKLAGILKAETTHA